MEEHRKKQEDLQEALEEREERIEAILDQQIDMEPEEGDVMAELEAVEKKVRNRIQKEDLAGDPTK